MRFHLFLHSDVKDCIYLNRLIIPSNTNNMIGKSKVTSPNPVAALLAFLTWALFSSFFGISIVDPNHTKKRIIEVNNHAPKSQLTALFLDEMILDNKLVIYTFFL